MIEVGSSISAHPDIKPLYALQEYVMIILLLLWTYDYKQARL